MPRTGRAFGLATLIGVLLLSMSSYSSDMKKDSAPSSETYTDGVKDHELEYFACDVKGKTNPSARSVEAKARKLAKAGITERALRCALHAAKLNPASAELWVLAGNLAKSMPGGGIPGAGETFISDCSLYSRAGQQKSGTKKEERVNISMLYAQCAATRGDCKKASLSLWALCKDFPNDFGVSLQASIVLAELSAAGTCEWGIAHKAFTELHSRFPEGNAHSYRSAALVLTQINNMSAALDLFHRSLALQEDDYTHSQAAITARFLDRYDTALHHAQRALAINPAQKEYLLDIGLALSKLGRYEECIKTLNKAYKAKPKHWPVLQELAMCNMGLGKYKQSAVLFEKAVKAGAPDYKLMLLAASAYSKLMLYNETRMAHEAAASMCEMSHAHLPDPERVAACVLANGRRMEHMQRQCEWGEWGQYAGLESALMERDNSERVLTPFQLTKGPFSVQALLHLSKVEALKKQPTPLPQVEAANTAPELPPGRMRVGFLWIGVYDSEFANNVVTVLEVLAEDERMELFWLALNEEDAPDTGIYAAQARAKRLFGDRFILFQTDPERVNHSEGASAAQAMRKLKLHVVINLPGWLNEASMSVSAAVPAAHQVSFKGYAGTLGASYVQHLVTDVISTPPELSHFYSEKLVYMPKTYYPVGNAAISQRLGTFDQRLDRTLRKEYGLPDEGIVLAAFNDHYKIDPFVWESWVKILTRLPGSVIWMLQHGAQESLKAELQSVGLDPGRIIASKFFPKDKHILIKGLSDVFLDTPLYNGHSTASDMLWAQVPVVTLAMEKMAARAGSSIIMAAGAGIGVARDIDDYADLAVRLSQHNTSLAMRAPGASLDHKQLAKTHVFDHVGFSRRLSRAFRCMHEAGPAFHVVAADL